MASHSPIVREVQMDMTPPPLWEGKGRWLYTIAVLQLQGEDVGHDLTLSPCNQLRSDPGNQLVRAKNSVCLKIVQNLPLW